MHDGECTSLGLREPLPSPSFVEAMGARTRYFHQGSGTPLLLIHGGDFDYRSLPSAEDWAPIFRSLTASHDVYAVDKLGAGQTDNPSAETDYTITAVTRHLLAFLDHLGLSKVILVGHSRGAYPVTRIAFDHPDRVSAVILLDTNTLAPDDGSVPPGFYTQFYEAPDAVPTIDGVRRLYDANSYLTDRNPFRALNTLESVHPDRPLKSAAIARMWDLNQRYFLPDLAATKEQLLTELETDGLRPPCLLIWGRNDRSAPLSIGLRLYDILAKRSDVVELHVLNHCGHHVPREHPTEVVSLIREFAARANEVQGLETKGGSRRASTS